MMRRRMMKMEEETVPPGISSDWLRTGFLDRTVKKVRRHQRA